MRTTFLHTLQAIAKAFLAAACISGCSTLPAFGPSGDAIANAATLSDKALDDTTMFTLTNLSAATMPSLNTHTALFPRALRQQRQASRDQRIQVSDVLEIRIWEVAEDGLFVTAGQRNTVLEVEVANSGNIEIPYGGTINARGMTTSDLRSALLDRYRGQAIEPEITARIVKTQVHKVAILGDVRTPQLFIIPFNGMKLLDLLAQAGGTEYPAWEIEIAVQRGGSMNSLNLADIVRTPQNNIIIFPDDTIHVTRAPRRFSVYGAVSSTANLTLPDESPNLSSLLAEAGGLNDMQAEAASVFIFRRSDQTQAPNKRPVVYRLDFSRPDAFLLANNFEMQANDIVYVATANASEFRKFTTTILSPFLGSTNMIQNIGE